MKKLESLAIILFVLVITGGCKQSEKQNDLITIDGTASHPEKELILQDFMDVEYITLETNDAFVTQGVVAAIGDKYLVVKNWINDGNIFVFDRKTGKAINKINRKGKGAEEYEFIGGIVLDEDNNELFVNCVVTKKLFVYDLSGNFKRSLKYREDADYSDVFNFDANNLICYDASVYYKDGENRGNQSYHLVISKLDGSITRKILIPFDVIKAPAVMEGDGVAVTSVLSVIPYHNTWLLVDTSSDTVYNYIPTEDKLIPLLVKTPAVDPEILLTMGTLTDRYFFITTMKKVFDFTKGRGFPISDLMYDRQEKTVFDPVVINSDFVKRKRVDLTSHPVNDKIAAFQNLEAYQLVEAYGKNELQGELKEIAAKLNEGSNPVIMVMKCKK